jgi:hypothetical protein
MSRRRLPVVTRSRWLRLAFALALLGAVACAGERGSTLQIYLFTTPSVAASEALVLVADRSGQRTLTGADFTSVGSQTPRSAEFGVATSGDLTVDVVLVKARSDTVGIGRLQISLQGNMRYGVDVHVASVNPFVGCIGCSGVVAFPLRGSLAGGPDSLYLTWGGAPPGSIT